MMTNFYVQALSAPVLLFTHVQQRLVCSEKYSRQQGPCKPCENLLHNNYYISWLTVYLMVDPKVEICKMTKIRPLCCFTLKTQMFQNLFFLVWILAL